MKNEGCNTASVCWNARSSFDILSVFGLSDPLFYTNPLLLRNGSAIRRKMFTKRSLVNRKGRKMIEEIQKLRRKRTIELTGTCSRCEGVKLLTQRSRESIATTLDALRVLARRTVFFTPIKSTTGTTCKRAGGISEIYRFLFV